MNRLTLTLIFGLVVLFYTKPVFPVKGGTLASRCTFPGVAVVTASPNLFLCSGVIVGNTIHVPYYCKASMIMGWNIGPITVNTGAYKWTIPSTTGPNLGTMSNGIYKFPLNESTKTAVSTNPTCTETGQMYDGTSALITSTCQLGGYGAAVFSEGTFNPDNLYSTPITKSTSVACCQAIQTTIPPAELVFVTNFNLFPMNCVYATGAACGIGDFGAPVMCNTTAGKRVTIGLTVTSPCVSKGLFLIMDTTGSSSKVKYGFSS